MNEKEFEELFGNTPFENIKKIQQFQKVRKMRDELDRTKDEYMKWQKQELEQKDKIIELLIKELYKKAHISTKCYLQTSIEECMQYKNCYECLKQYFENKAKEMK